MANSRLGDPLALLSSLCSQYSSYIFSHRFPAASTLVCTCSLSLGRNLSHTHTHAHSHTRTHAYASYGKHFVTIKMSWPFALINALTEWHLFPGEHNKDNACACFYARNSHLFFICSPPPPAPSFFGIYLKNFNLEMSLKRWFTSEFVEELRVCCGSQWHADELIHKYENSVTNNDSNNKNNNNNTLIMFVSCNAFYTQIPQSVVRKLLLSPDQQVS